MRGRKALTLAPTPAVWIRVPMPGGRPRSQASAMRVTPTTTVTSRKLHPVARVTPLSSVE
ncbi:MAG TPA: hypothetical protein VK038_11520 [Ornithinicoccus sp.]|nr:hypothetical protein [Ornithinicoccus sp.]